MRELYFDIDGSVLVGDTGKPKRMLADGAFERAVRRSGVQKLICVGSLVDVGRAVKEVKPSYDMHKEILQICSGVFEDEDWFRAHTGFVRDSQYRAAEVNLDADWWYVDDLAERYFSVAERQDVFLANRGRRILVPSPKGDGQDVLEWIDGIG